MPTIKLQNGKVILKDGKVSCSCCEGPEPEECCMYPADGLGDTYEAADLPDELIFYVGVYNFPLMLTKDTTGFPTPIYSGSDTDGATGDAFTADIYDGPSTWDGQFTILPGVGSENPEIPNGNFGQRCLIFGDGNLTPGDDTVEDQFADCYEVSNPGNGNDVAAGTVQVFRVSLCRWESANFNDGPISNALRASLEYLSGGEFEDDPRGDLWSAFSGTLQAESPAGGVKESLSSPLGTYEGDFLPNVTVSPCF